MNWFELGNWVRRRAYESALSYALKRRPTALFIEIAGPEAKSNDFVSILIDENKEAPKIIIGRRDDFLICLEKDRAADAQDEREVEVPISSVDPTKFHIRHYYGLQELHFKGIWEFWRAITFRVPYFRIELGIAKENFAQARFNRRGLVIHDRMRVLRSVVALFDESEKNSFSRWEVLMALYSARAVEHPGHSRALQFITMHLDAFAESGELQKVLTNYSVQPKAIQTLEDYERMERRQKEVDNLQIWMIVLTVLLVIIALLQAIAAAIQGKVILVPTLLDLTKYFGK